MRRGDIVTAATGGGLGSKPRPALIVQSDLFAAAEAVTLCLLTTRDVGATLLLIGASLAIVLDLGRS